MSSNLRDAEVIDVGPRKRRRLIIWLLVAGVILLFSFSRIISIYLSALWFGSLGYSSVYWYVFKIKIALFAGSAILTALLLSATFLLFQRLFGAYAFENRTIILNNQPFQFSPAKFIRPLGWFIAGLFGLIYGFSLKEHWRQLALYWYQPATATHDPIFGKSLGFYLFSLPLYNVLSSWLLGVTFIILCAALAYSLLGFASNGVETECALVVRRRISRGLCGARIVSAGAELEHVSLALPIPLARPSDFFRSDLHRSELHAPCPVHRLYCANCRRDYSVS